MKKKFFISTLIIVLMTISFVAGSVWEALKHFEGPHLCNPVLATPEEKEDVLKNYIKKVNPFYELPNWYNKKYLPETKNFYVQNQSSTTELTTTDIYHWSNSAYLEIGNGDVYRMSCRK